MDNYNNYNPQQPGYPQQPVQPPMPPQPPVHGTKSLVFGILSIVMNFLGGIILMCSSAGVTVSSDNLDAAALALAGMIGGLVAACVFGFIFNIVGLVFAGIATRNAGYKPTGKAMGGKVTGIIGRVLNIISLVCYVILIILVIVLAAAVASMG